MQPSNCDEYLTHEIVEEAFKKKITAWTDRIIECLFKCCYNSFINTTLNNYRSYPADSVEDMADRSFTNAILAFGDYAIRKGFRKEAKSITIFRSFCIKTFNNFFREDSKTIGGIGTPDPDGKKADGLAGSDMKEHLRKEADYECLHKSLNELSDDDRKVLFLKYWKRKRLDEIAREFNTSAAYIAEKLFRLRNRLEKMIEQCKRNRNEDKPHTI